MHSHRDAFRSITVAERTLGRAISSSEAVVGKYLQPYAAAPDLRPARRPRNAVAVPPRTSREGRGGYHLTWWKPIVPKVVMSIA